MKHKALTVMALFVSCALMGGCETLTIAPSEQAAEIVYADIKNDTTETLRQILINNKAILMAENENKK